MVRAASVPPRVLILSWEYPPIVEGGLARHVRKLSEQLVEQGAEVHVLTRGDRFRLPGEPLVPRARLRRRYLSPGCLSGFTDTGTSGSSAARMIRLCSIVCAAG